MREQRELVIDFWDVGQADCTVIHLPDGRLFIIDVGRRGSPLADWLADKHPAPRIAAIVLTHNDSDHAGALPGILDRHASSIDTVWMLRDRPNKDEPFAKIFRRVARAEEEGLEVRRLEAPWELWKDESRGLRLRAAYPTFTANEAASRPNDTCGLILLEQGDALLCAWPGDLPVHVVADRVGGSAGLLHGPHHGGPTDFKGPDRGRYRAGVETLSPRLAFISVGSRNPYCHPRPSYVQLLAHRGCRVVCSQITNACDRDRFREGRLVFDGSGALGLRSARSGTPCRGAWRVVLRDCDLVPDQYTQVHLERIAELHRPQCLRGSGWRKGDPLPW